MTTVTSTEINVSDGTVSPQSDGSLIVEGPDGTVRFTPQSGGHWLIEKIVKFGPSVALGVVTLLTPAYVKPFVPEFGARLAIDLNYTLSSTGFGFATASETTYTGKFLDGVATTGVQALIFEGSQALLVPAALLIPGLPAGLLTAIGIGAAVLVGAVAGTAFSAVADFDHLDQTIASYIDAVKDLFDAASSNISPLVLDLDGDGVELTALNGSQSFFDLDADGFAERTGWVTGGDGLLAIDSNGDGKINNINELFGNATTNGFAILSALDSNGDNVINSSDAQFSNLRIWIDANQNGVTDAGELVTLADRGIASINLAATETNTTLNGNLISHVSSFTRDDGSTGQVADVWFANDQINTQFTGEFTASPEVFLLPRVRGYGQVPDLHIAISLDPTLFARVEQLAHCDPENCTDLGDQIDEIIYRWAGVDALDPASRGGLIDARRLGALEKFLGQAWTGVAGAKHREYLRRAA
jgi:hypothetical protein